MKKIGYINQWYLNMIQLFLKLKFLEAIQISKLKEGKQLKYSALVFFCITCTSQEFPISISLCQNYLLVFLFYQIFNYLHLNIIPLSSVPSQPPPSHFPSPCFIPLHFRVYQTADRKYPKQTPHGLITVLTTLLRNLRIILEQKRKKRERTLILGVISDIK